MSIVAPEKPPRKFPAPCWTQDETLALIDAYRERWYALRRGYLRTADWETVAADVSARCPDASPAKTSAQCRHKMEKLRQRYRAEKQRSASFPGRFFSSWFFFDNMDAMENGGSSSAVGSNHPDTGNQADYHSVFRIKSVGDRNLVESVMKPKNLKKNSLNLNQNLDSNPNLVTVSVRGKSFGNVEGSFRPNLGHNSSYLDYGSDGDYVKDAGFGTVGRFRVPFDEKLLNPLLKGKKLVKVQGNNGVNHAASQYRGNDFDDGAAFYVKNSFEPVDLPPGFRMKSFGEVQEKMNPNFVSADCGFGGNSMGKNFIKCEVNTDVVNGFPPGFGDGSFRKSSGRGMKRERSAVDEMVYSIKLLGEGFVKMEKMKMDMAREIEKMRMEMDLKRNELILESQRQIVDAFVRVLLESNNVKKDKNRRTVVPES